jgi:hypothetical protein
MAMGDALADEVKRVLDEHNLTVDVVIPVNTFLYFLVRCSFLLNLTDRYLTHLE